MVIVTLFDGVAETGVERSGMVSKNIDIHHYQTFLIIVKSNFQIAYFSLCSTVQYSTVQYCTVQHTTVQYSTVQCSAVQCSTAQHSTVQYSTAHYSRVQ